MTNYHVIADVQKRPNMTIRVVMADRNGVRGVLVGAAPDYDLAVLKFAPQSQPPRDTIKKIELGTSHDLQVGQKVFAIGNPFGLSLTMTRASSPRSTARSNRQPIPRFRGWNPDIRGRSIQAIRAARCWTSRGRLIGVNSAITTPTSNGGNVGIGFAIPADTVNRVVTQIIQSGRAYSSGSGHQALRSAETPPGAITIAVS